MTVSDSTATLLADRIGQSQVLNATMLNDGKLLEASGQFLNVTTEALLQGRTLFFFGNGGSAADSVHIAAEFLGRYLVDRRPLPAVSLASNISALTAIGNDYGFELVFSRQIEALGKSGDVAVGLTTSGRSRNVQIALESAQGLGMRTVALTGADPGPVGDASELTLSVPSSSTPLIQQAHMQLAHMACEWSEEAVVNADAS